MAARRHSDYQFRFDTEPDSNYRSERDDLRIERLGQRMTLFFILFPCIIGVVFFVAYLDIKGRVTQTSSSGTSGFQKLSQDLESRFSSLSLKQAKLEEDFAQSAKSFHSTADTLKSALDAAETEIAKLQEAMPDKAQNQREIEALQASLAKSAEALTPLNDGLKTLSSDIEILDKRVTQEIGDLNSDLSAAQKGLSSLKSELAALSKAKIGTKELALKLNEEKVAMEARLGALKKEMQGDIAKLEKNISALEKKIERLEKKAAKPAPASPAKSTTPAKTTTPPVKTETAPPQPAPDLPTPTPGKILEQELKE